MLLECAAKEIKQLWQIFLSCYIILGLPHIIFSPEFSCSSNQRFLSEWVFQFVKMPGVLIICYCRKPLGILMVLKHKKFYYFF